LSLRISKIFGSRKWNSPRKKTLSFISVSRSNSVSDYFLIVPPCGIRVGIDMKKLFLLALAAWAALTVEVLAQSSQPPRNLRPPTPVDGDGFGTAVVAFGNDILIGAPGDDSLATDAGAVYLFESGTGKLLRAFTNPSPDAGDNFGAAIAVFGSTIVIGAPGKSIEVRDVGAAYLFDGNTGDFLDA
jgi:hypothetical protein